eukprot:3724772-Rhodomonas_salina.1
MWKDDDLLGATLWVHSKDEQQKALIRVGTSIRLHTYGTWKSALTELKQWVNPMVFERTFGCDATFENMGKKLEVEWYRGARAPLTMVIWPVKSVRALDELLKLL